MKLHPTGSVLLGGAMSLGWIALLSACERQAAGAVPPHRDTSAAHDSAAQAARPSEVFERVRKIVVRQLEVDPRRVTENANFIKDLGADSLDTVELIMAFEEEFDATIPDEVTQHIETVGDAVNVIEGCQQKYSVTDIDKCQILSH